MREKIKSINIKNEAAMVGFAQKIAKIIRAGDILLLEGDLGAGKSFFTRALIRALGEGNEDVPSPTFTLVQCYDLKTAARKPIMLYHFDLYRLNDAEEIWEIGWEEALESDGCMAVVEWPCRLGGYRPDDALSMLIIVDNKDKNARHIELSIEKLGTDWQERLKIL